MNTKTMRPFTGLPCGLPASALRSPGNSTSRVEVSPAGGQDDRAHYHQEPLRSVPPNFAVASPARIAFELSEHRQRARPRQPGHRPGELRSMNVGAGQRPHPRGAEPAPLRGARGEPRWQRAGDQPVRAAGRADHAGRTGRRTSPKAGPKPRTPSATSTSAAARRRGRVCRSLRHEHGHRHPPAGPERHRRVFKTSLPDNLRRRLDVVDFGTRSTRSARSSRRERARHG